ncbi:universal stress protein [Cognaticolwellia beringensis]|uniref:Universal stress protein n=1 Tax=Cognaticolwellia beringensis TaxID=1967665 RepID=A0A222GCV2_9GAMM|nr:universal stress protein [Cognaticolwellia beringensis]ASP49686.1 universal stress protein [Cognaticolwellia beringensis]
MTTLHIVLSDLEVTHAILAKITKLQNKYSANVVWYLHHHQRFFDRLYFSNELADISDDLQASHQSKVAQIGLKITKYFPKSSINICKDKYWSKQLNNNANSLDKTVIIRSKTGLTSADNQYISDNKSTIFILNQEKWFSDGKAIGAIDPFHEDDEENISARNVVDFMRHWSSASEQTEPLLLHVIHIPPLAIEYEKKIEALHKEQIYRFAKTVKCPKNLLTFTRGTPEDALLSYADNNKIDLIVLGCREHSLFDKWLNGSTISALISHQQCDIVLINTP